MKTEENKTSGDINRIGLETEIKGDLLSKGNFRVDGKIQGNIKTQGKIVIGSKGFIKGTIECVEADIEGTVDGSINVERVLTLRSTCNIKGDTIVGRLSVEPGAIFNGVCKMRSATNNVTPPQKAQKIQKAN